VNHPNPALPTHSLLLKPKWIVAACLLLVVYLLLRPWLVERFGLDLPGFTDSEPKVEAPASDSATTAQQKREKNRPIEVPVIPEQSEPVMGEESEATESISREGTPAPVPTVKNTTNATSPTLKATRPSTTPPAQPDKPSLGVLQPAGRDRFVSTSGLVYSQYRIDHVMEHSRDNPDKPSHGVFEGTRDEILALIDEAYQLAQKRGPPQVVIEDQGDRTTYTVNLNRKIGHGGGQSGARRRHPPLKMIKIVLEEDEVITAYPTER
jgi:hypothetical protein